MPVSYHLRNMLESPLLCTLLYSAMFTSVVIVCTGGKEATSNIGGKHVSCNLVCQICHLIFNLCNKGLLQIRKFCCYGNFANEINLVSSPDPPYKKEYRFKTKAIIDKKTSKPRHALPTKGTSTDDPVHFVGSWAVGPLPPTSTSRPPHVMNVPRPSSFFFACLPLLCITVNPNER